MLTKMLNKKFKTVDILDGKSKLLSKRISYLQKCPCTFTFTHFLDGVLPEVQNHFRKQFSHKVLYKYCYKLFLGAFRSVLKK